MMTAFRKPPRAENTRPMGPKGAVDDTPAHRHLLANGEASSTVYFDRAPTRTHRAGVTLFARAFRTPASMRPSRR